MGVLSCAALVLVAGTAMGQASGQGSGQAGGRGVQGGQPVRGMAMDGESLPLRAITLYRSGVGAFLREGRVTGEQTITLQFATDQVNDILKSMVVLDLDGGSVDSVNFASKLPLSRRLEGFGVDVSGSPSVEELLQQLSGERITMLTPDGQVGGVIMSVERKQVPVASPSGDGMIAMSRAFVNLLTSQGIRSVELDSVRSFELANEDLARDLARALSTIADFRGEQQTGVDVRLSGEGDGARRIVVGYTHEMPVWKTSYRLVLPEDSGAGRVDENGVPLTRATVQGWAIVENTTDGDWSDVRLSLASGRPVSFTMNLHESLFVPRVELPVPVGVPLVGKNYESGLARSPAPAPGVAGREMDALRSQSALTMAERANTRSGGSGGGQFGADMGEEFFSFAVGEGTMGPGQASGDDTAGQFLYTIDAPVSIDAGQSSMLPIIVTEIPARHVSIFNASDMPKHPLKGVELVNTTGLHFMPGPIAVYDGATYAGDSQIPHTSRNQDRLLSYALDVDVFVQTEQEQQHRTSRIRVVDGLLEHTIRRSWTTTYSLQSFDASRERTVLIEHGRVGGWELITPKTPEETLENMYRFEVRLDRGGKASLPVVIERTDLSRITLADWTPEQFLSYASDNGASERMLAAAREAARMKTDAALVEQQIKDINDRIDEIARDQSRIRENLGRIGGESDLRRRYLQTLSDQEDEMEELLSRRDTLQKTLDDRRAALREYLRNLDVE
ncbi:MAG: hypothetical protein ACTS3F_05140 [Phycisphaerales bacterium]